MESVPALPSSSASVLDPLVLSDPEHTGGLGVSADVDPFAVNWAFMSPVIPAIFAQDLHQPYSGLSFADPSHFQPAAPYYDFTNGDEIPPPILLYNQFGSFHHLHKPDDHFDNTSTSHISSLPAASFYPHGETTDNTSQPIPSTTEATLTATTPTSPTSNASSLDAPPPSPATTVTSTYATAAGHSPKSYCSPPPLSPTSPIKAPRRKKKTTGALQRNRAAASRCRARTTEKSTALEVKEQECRLLNQDLRGQAANLRNEVLDLRVQLLHKADEPGCSCGRLKRYIRRRAVELCLDDDERFDDAQDHDTIMSGASDAEGEWDGDRVLSDIEEHDEDAEAAQESTRTVRQTKRTQKKMAEENLTDQGVWGTEGVPLVVDFSVGATTSPVISAASHNDRSGLGETSKPRKKKKT